MKVYFSIDKDRRITSWGTSPVTDDYIEKDLPADHEVLLAPGHFKITEEGEFIKDDGFLLNVVQESKMQELSTHCRNEILGYFEATVNSEPYLFSFDQEAQSNFIGALALFTKGLIQEMEWTVHQNGITKRIILDENQFLQVVDVAFKSKDKHISRLRNDLQTKVYNAKTVEEVEAIKWSEEIQDETLLLEPPDIY